MLKLIGTRHTCCFSSTPFHLLNKKQPCNQCFTTRNSFPYILALKEAFVLVAIPMETKQLLLPGQFRVVSVDSKAALPLRLSLPLVQQNIWFTEKERCSYEFYYGQYIGTMKDIKSMIGRVISLQSRVDSSCRSSYDAMCCQRFRIRKPLETISVFGYKRLLVEQHRDKLIANNQSIEELYLMQQKVWILVKQVAQLNQRFRRYINESDEKTKSGLGGLPLEILEYAPSLRKPTFLSFEQAFLSNEKKEDIQRHVEYFSFSVLSYVEPKDEDIVMALELQNTRQRLELCYQYLWKRRQVLLDRMCIPWALYHIEENNKI